MCLYRHNPYKGENLDTYIIPKNDNTRVKNFSKGYNIFIYYINFLLKIFLFDMQKKFAGIKINTTFAIVIQEGKGYGVL